MKAVLLLAATLTTACGSRDEQPAPARPAQRPEPQVVSDLEDPPNDPGDTPASTPPPAPANVEAALIPPNVMTRRGGALAPGETALSFASPSAPPSLLAWYRSPQRRGAFSVSSELDEGAEHVLSGSLAPSAGRVRADFSVRIAPTSGGGSTAMVLVTGRR